MERISSVVDDLLGRKPPKEPEWKITPNAEKIKGLFVKEFNCDSMGLISSVKLVPATPERIIGGKILRNAKGNPALFNEKGKEVGHIKVDYDMFTMRPIEYKYRGRVIAYLSWM